MNHSLAIRLSGGRFSLFLNTLFKREPVFTAAALLMLGLMLPTLTAMALETRTVLGENAWIKPLKFELAFGIYLATLAWFTAWLPPAMTKKRTYRIYSHVVVFCVLVEMVWIGGAAMWATRSHFNSSSELAIIIYQMMGIFAVILISATAVYGIQIARNRNTKLQPAFKLAVVLGLMITCLSTLIVASYLASNGGHFVGGSGVKPDGFPIMGWSRDSGDLRVAHFFASHALHFIPIFAYLAIKAKPVARLRFWVIVISAAYIALIAYTFLQAISGQPFLAVVDSALF